MKKIKGKRLDNAIAAMFNKHGNRRQFNIMDLGKISAAGRGAYDAAATHEDGLAAADKAVAEACDRYEVGGSKVLVGPGRPGQAFDYGDVRIETTLHEVHPARPARPADPCLAATLADAAKDAPPAEGDLDFRIPGL